ncbi:MAG TPA: hypothetical protein VKX34_09300 [Aequorivita sp.]|nr:hypothetical protein [Aequorivita sp.]
MISLLLNFFTLHAFGKGETDIAIDTSKVERKQFSNTLSEKYTGNQYKYDSLEGETENLLGRIINWIFKKLNDVFGIDLPSGWQQLAEIVIYGSLVGFALYILVKFLMGNQAASFFSRKSKSVAPINIQEDHIQNIDLDAYITKALQEENYRLAIRYMYLKSLKLLSQNNLIEWNHEKTNSDYYNEIENGELKSSFNKISYWYDHIWYGEFTLDKSGFENAEKDFNQLNQNLKYAG